MYGSPYYVEGLKKGWKAPKKAALEKAAAMQKEVLDLAVSMQMKITDYIKTDHVEPPAPQSPKKARAKSGPKKRVQADQTSTSSSSGASSAITSSTASSSRSTHPMYIPKGPVPYAEAEDDPIIITVAQISTLILHATATADTWVDTEGKHYRKCANGLIAEME